MRECHRSPRLQALMAALAAFALAPAGAAVVMVRADLADLTLEQLSNVVVTAVSRREERLSDAPASIYVITAQEIRASGANSLPGVLRMAPNLNVARADATQYAISARGFNNVLANRMLVRIDGRTVYSPLFSGVFWEAQDLLLADIERIEVISGPGAALWGANAVNGVINITTRHAKDTPGALVVAGYGTQVNVLGARQGFALGGGNMRLYAKGIDRANSIMESGAPFGDSLKHALAGFRGDWATGRTHWTVEGQAQEGSVDIAGPDREFSGGHLLARAASTDDKANPWSVQAYVDRVRRQVPGSYRDHMDTFDVEVQYGMDFGRHDILVGGGYRQSRDRFEGSPALAFVPANRDLEWSNAFVHDQFRIGDSVAVTLGAKVERNSYTGTEFLPTARLAWHLAPDRLLWGALSRTVRAPSRLDRDLVVGAQAPFTLLGNNSFDSEVANVFELGWRAHPDPSLSYSLTAFHHQHENLRSLAPSPAGPVFANGLEGHTSGVEGWARFQAAPTWLLSLGGVAMDQRLRVRPGAMDAGGRASLGNDPDYWVKARSIWNITPRHELSVAVRHIGALPNPAVPAYTAVDARVAWRRSPELEFSLTVQNLFDQRHAEWGPAATRAVFERAAFLRVQWRP